VTQEGTEEMTTTASRRLRGLGLVLVSIAAVAMFASFLIHARFGHEFEFIHPICALTWTVSFWIGLVCYFIGRFQKRP
jgi:hypothetical protein